MSRAIEVLQSQKVRYIDPEQVAESVELELDDMRVSPPLIRHATILHLRSVVRKCLSKKMPGVLSMEESEQSDMFASTLQAHYPAGHHITGKPTWVRREYLDVEQRATIVAKLRKTGDANHAHADLLEEEGEVIAASIRAEAIE